MTIENVGEVETKVTEIRATTSVHPASTASAPVRGPLDLIAEQWPVLAFAACAVMLGAAHAFETFGKLAPCLLCLKQREVYWVTGTVALVAVAASRTPWADRARRPLILLLAIGFLFGAGVATYHAGAEWKWWPGPAACAAGGAASASDLVAMLKGAKIAAPSCDKAVWVFLGLSMAGWNAVISLGLAIASAFAALRAPVSPRAA
ncbi:disulfide bond formation protein DsbB [Caulobacter sp. Root1455]|uniref:disulfide bond formation protein B n=1 Tax=unclassified Caulobacter TaxID=2648921 RepID=UPI000701B7B0|nr:MULTISPECIES: disulfide bond formation protein B [unclassified Caulobacter]KQY30412.1 disulfide bond formation protein DsbB [Caulobacter sp. Root487D2Y]KQY92870.1 disulfide bond formation protein DsbB [Caulobacter sp. Root1455]